MGPRENCFVSFSSRAIRASASPLSAFYTSDLEPRVERAHLAWYSTSLPLVARTSTARCGPGPSGRCLEMDVWWRALSTQPSGEFGNFFSSLSTHGKASMSVLSFVIGHTIIRHGLRERETERQQQSTRVRQRSALMSRSVAHCCAWAGGRVQRAASDRGAWRRCAPVLHLKARLLQPALRADEAHLEQPATQTQAFHARQPPPPRWTGVLGLCIIRRVARRGLAPPSLRLVPAGVPGRRTCRHASQAVPPRWDATSCQKAAPLTYIHPRGGASRRGRAPWAQRFLERIRRTPSGA
jgi:hypothetical protein